MNDNPPNGSDTDAVLVPGGWSETAREILTRWSSRKLWGTVATVGVLLVLMRSSYVDGGIGTTLVVAFAAAYLGIEAIPDVIQRLKG